MAPHRGFKYDVVALLNAVRDQPAIWDRTQDIYKDKVERKNAWDQILSMLDDKYDQMSWEEKKATSEHVINKWTNIRDTFVKSLKNKAGKPKKKYLLHDQLKFLIKVIPEEELCIEEYSADGDEPSSMMKQELEVYQEYEPQASSARKKKRTDSNEEYVPRKSKRNKGEVASQDSSRDSDYNTYDTSNNIDFVEVDSKMESDPRVMNEDEAFFASLLPSVVKYNEDERLEFRIEVLSLMKKIKEKRKWQNY